VATPSELERKLWKSLDSDRTVMVGLDGAEGGHLRPLTALIEEDQPRLWFFTAKDTALVERLSSESEQRAVVGFASKGHDLFASLQGTLVIDNDRKVIDRLWNPFIAAWYEGGKDDPKLTLMRFEAEAAEIWENESSLVAGAKVLLGIDPKRSYRDHVAKVDLQ
jgi:general stress protein 26